ncbi:hypothetical protein FT663_04533 [Candidozyma haemuli var. vulneris]|uniref:Methyltransferase domain-containing protein n=1 Tax=Candidozyma haemuli TaxID=45357 RepID=A0A2V1ANI2_9ASCO|nr:hypothetical protein CXQ85_001570 [[Candida] haemuloni]KAF3986471.1 hypothetical protein FT662_04538 [[Candida] haemuloni var. vulneris]KAF3987274.1 hypothetical protein FT663_04533 [[Candida] haemuloni var. vulneris]PVH19264.1 hypothetical protein CXQ85_001570 [[Candida] haemuloni]
MSHQASVDANRNTFDNSYDNIIAMQMISQVFASSIVNFDLSAPRKPFPDTEEPIDVDQVIADFHKLKGITGNLLKPDSKVLDFACGTGLVAERLVPFMPDGQFVGIDITPSMLESFDKRAETLSKTYPNLKIKSICADIMDNFDMTPLEGFADLLICTLSFHHIHAYEKVAEELKRMVKPGGWILIYDFYNEDLENEEITNELKARGMARHGLTLDEMNQCLEKNCVNVSSAREFRAQLWVDEKFINSHCKEEVKRDIHNAPQKDGLFRVNCSVILGMAQKK